MEIIKEVLENVYKKREQRKKENKKWARNWFKDPKNKLKVIAHRKVFVAKRNGTLIPTPCIFCGNLKVEAHHTDYNQPLKVDWLCKKHHIIQDKIARV